MHMPNTHHFHLPVGFWQAVYRTGFTTNTSFGVCAKRLLSEVPSSQELSSWELPHLSLPVSLLEMLPLETYVVHPILLFFEKMPRILRNPMRVLCPKFKVFAALPFLLSGGSWVDLTFRFSSGSNISSLLRLSLWAAPGALSTSTIPFLQSLMHEAFPCDYRSYALYYEDAFRMFILSPFVKLIVF